MKKGFTLIELLIVMVVVGILVTVALPKYYSSMERGRALEGISNLRAASDFVNAKYVMQGNQYVKNSIADTSDRLLGGDTTKRSYFGFPLLYSLSSDTAVIFTSRADGSYDLYAINQNGELKYIACSGDAELCKNAGMEEATFTDSYSNSNLILNFQ